MHILHIIQPIYRTDSTSAYSYFVSVIVQKYIVFRTTSVINAVINVIQNAVALSSTIYEFSAM